MMAWYISAPSRLDPRLHIGDLLLDHLVAADWRAKSLTFARINQRRFVGRFRDAEGLRRDADAPGVQHGHRYLETLA